MANWGCFEWFRRWFVLPHTCNSLGDIASKLGKSNVYTLVYTTCEIFDNLGLAPADLAKKILDSLRSKLNAQSTSGVVSNFADLAEDAIIKSIENSTNVAALSNAITEMIMSAK